MADPRALDPAARYLVAAAALGLRDAGVKLRGALRERAGLFVGTTCVSPTSRDEFMDSIERRGLARLSALAFTRLVLNASAGSCATALELRGPLTNLTVGEGSGLVAMAYAAWHLARDRAADLIVAAGLDELPREEASVEATEGAACLVLSAGPPAAGADGRPVVRLAGWGLAGPGDAKDAARQALGRASLDAADLDALFATGLEAGESLSAAPALAPIDPTRSLGRAVASSSAVAAVAAFGALRQGRCRTALVLAAGGRSSTSALLLTTRGPHGC